MQPCDLGGIGLQVTHITSRHFLDFTTRRLPLSVINGQDLLEYLRPGWAVCGLPSRHAAVPVIAIRTRESADLQPVRMIHLLRMYQSSVTVVVYISDSFPIMHAAVQSPLALGTVHPTTNTNLYARWSLIIDAHAPTNGNQPNICEVAA